MPLSSLFLPSYLPFLTESSSQRNIPLNHILLDFPNPIDQGCMSVKGRPIPLTVGLCIHFTHAACAWRRASASFFRGSVKARASADGPHSPPPPSGEETRSVRSAAAAAASITVLPAPSLPPFSLCSQRAPPARTYLLEIRPRRRRTMFWRACRSVLHFYRGSLKVAPSKRHR